MGEKIAFAMKSTCKCNKGSIDLPLERGDSNLKLSGMSILVETVKPIIPFGICSELTQKANGTPTPCVLAIAGSWDKKSKYVKINGKRALLDKATIKCSIGGTIKLTVKESKVEEG